MGARGGAWTLFARPVPRVPDCRAGPAAGVDLARLGLDHRGNAYSSLGLDVTLHGQDDRTLYGGPTGAEGEAPELELSRGMSIGRYTLLDQLGRGGMGVIWAAYDAQLDRKIALKLLLVETEGSRTRLLREAQALAKLTHPNVVTIYDTGVHEDQVWIAMEFIDGRTLRAWLKEQPRDWRAIRAVMLDAGRGLAAAHDKGLVHRDFKPENVMIDHEEGRVRVMDFGLVRSEDGPEADPERELEADKGPETEELGASSSGVPVPIYTDEDISRPLDTDITRGGAVMGTPAYMAPEQHLGLPADPRADQFGFCITLWEALYGQRPFSGINLSALAFSVCQGEMAEPPRGADVPSWLRRVAERGLATKRDDRYASMNELLEALGHEPGARWRVAAVGGLCAALVAGLWGFVEFGDRRARAMCGEDAQAIRESWGSTKAAVVSAAFERTELTHASEAWERTRARLDEWATKWSGARLQACVEAEVEGSREAESLAQSRACLDHHRASFDGLVSALGEVDRETIHAAVLSAVELRDPASCLDEDHAQVVVPTDLELAAKVTEQRQTLHRAEALHKLGRYDEASEAAQAVVEQAASLGWAPLEAEALLDLGRTEHQLGRYEAAEAHLERAFLLAGEAGDELLMALAAAEQVRVVGDYQARHDEGLRWGRLAALYLQRLGMAESSEFARLKTISGRIHQLAGHYDEADADFTAAYDLVVATLGPEHPRLASLLNNQANLDQVQGDNESSLERLRRAETIYARVLGPEHPKVAIILNNMGNANRRLGRNREALEVYSEALALREAAFGPEHPDVATALSNLGTAYLSLERNDEAREVSERALAIREAKLGPEHPRVSTTLNNLGEIHAQLGELETALSYYERALAIRKTALGPTHPRVGTPLNGLGEIKLALGNIDEALAAHEEALAIYTEAFGPRHAEVARTKRNIGVALRERKDYEAAAAVLEEALELEKENFGPESPHVAYAHYDLGLVEEARGRSDAAAEHFEAALARFETWESAKPTASPSARWALARVSSDPDEARALAFEARTALAKLDEAELVAEIDAWLRTAGR